MLTARGPDGRTWQVRRRWTRRRPRWRWRGGRHGLDALDVGFEAMELGPLAVIGVVIAVLAALFLVLPALLLVLDLLVIAAVILLGLVAKVLLRRPWDVEAETDGPPPDAKHWRVVGWRASGRAVEQAAQALEAGVEPQFN